MNRASISGLRRGVSLAATPGFAVMAALCAVYQDDIAAICGSGSGVWTMTSMVWMYILMSLAHIGAWLRLLEDRETRQMQDRRSLKMAVAPRPSKDEML